jgi:hypothetical protein
MVSALLEGEPLRVASWWTSPEIPTTSAATPVACWDPALGQPGAVEIATTGAWQGKTLGFEGFAEPQGNHAKIGVSMWWPPRIDIGMRQQGMLPAQQCGAAESSPEWAHFRRICSMGICRLPYVIFGDMNQQGTLSGSNCASSQNGRGGLFFAVQDIQLFRSVRDLLQGQTAPQ